MSKQREVEIENGDQRATVLASAVPAWERHGWTVVDDEGSEVQPVEAPQTPVEYEVVEVAPDPATNETKE